MECLNLLLYISLIFITMIKADENSKNISSEIDNVLPIFYSVKIKPHLQPNFIFDVETDIRIKIQNATMHIPLQLNLACVVTIQRTVLIDKNDTTYRPHKSSLNEMLIMKLVFDVELQPGFYTLQLTFQGKESRKQINGAYNKYFRDENDYTVWVAVKPFITIPIRRDLLCYDHPQLKPTINISIESPSEYTILSNMLLQKKDEATEYNKIISHFIITSEMSICEVTIVLFNFVWTSNADETLNIWYRPAKIFKIEPVQYVTGNVIQHLVELTNISKNIDFIVIPGFPTHDLGNSGFIICNEDDIYDTIQSVEQNTVEKNIKHKKFAASITNEIMQSWFNNLIIPASSSDLWLTTGLVYFLKAYILDKIFENWQIMDFMAIRNLSLCLYMDSYLYHNNGSRINSLASGRDNPQRMNYLEDNVIFPNFQFSCSLFQDKGPLILRMMRHLISDDLFREGINLFFRTHRFKSVTTNDFWTAMQTNLHSTDNFRNLDIKKFMNPWIMQENYPFVKVTRLHDDTTIIELDQNSYPNFTSIWYIPITYTIQSKLDFDSTLIWSPNLWLPNPATNDKIFLTMTSPEWIIVNVQRIGYYRVNYDSISWLRIADYLDSENYIKIHANNRVQLIDDAFYLMLNGQINSTIFCSLTKYLSRTTDYISWYPMFWILPRLEDPALLNNETECQENLANNFLRFLGEIEYGDDAINEDDFIKKNTYMAIQWAYKYNTSLCKKLALDKLQKYLANDSTDKISSLWRDWIYCTGLHTADMSTWDKVWYMYKQNNDSTFLNYLACSEDISIIMHYLNTLLTEYSTYGNSKAGEIQFAYDAITIRHLHKDKALDNLINTVGKLKFFSNVNAMLKS